MPATTSPGNSSVKPAQIPTAYTQSPLRIVAAQEDVSSTEDSSPSESELPPATVPRRMQRGNKRVSTREVVYGALGSSEPIDLVCKDPAKAAARRDSVDQAKKCLDETSYSAPQARCDSVNTALEQQPLPIITNRRPLVERLGDGGEAREIPSPGTAWSLEKAIYSTAPEERLPTATRGWP